MLGLIGNEGHNFGKHKSAGSGPTAAFTHPRFWMPTRVYLVVFVFVMNLHKCHVVSVHVDFVLVRSGLAEESSADRGSKEGESMESRLNVDSTCRYCKITFHADHSVSNLSASVAGGWLVSDE